MDKIMFNIVMKGPGVAHSI